jgi:hypothetical protein
MRDLFLQISSVMQSQIATAESEAARLGGVDAISRLEEELERERERAGMAVSDAKRVDGELKRERKSASEANAERLRLAASLTQVKRHIFGVGDVGFAFCFWLFFHGAGGKTKNDFLDRHSDSVPVEDGKRCERLVIEDFLTWFRCRRGKEQKKPLC